MTNEKNRLYIDETRLELYAENYARGLAVSDRRGGAGAAKALRRALRELGAARDAMELKWGGLPSMPGAARWLLENCYLAEREGKLAAGALEHAGLSRFAGDAPLPLALCETLLRTGLGELTEERTALFLRGFQRKLVLERGELAALAAGLRYAVVRSLAKLYRVAEPEDGETEAEAARLFTALRWLSSADLRELVEDADAAERLLRRDPAGVYPRMAESSRDAYRRDLARLAKRRGMAEHTAAQRALELADEAAEREGKDSPRAHVGWWISRAPLGIPAREKRGGAYIAVNVLGTLFLSLLAGFLCRSAAAAALLLAPVGELVKCLADALLLRFARPAHVPRLALETGVPAGGRTLCAVSALLSKPTDGPALARRLEEHYLLSRDAGPELRFAVLADLPDGREERYPGQEEIISAAASAVEQLNGKYGGGFYLLTRPRVRSREGTFGGWERKRGALLETMRFLRGRSSTIAVAAGDADTLAGTKYLLALDSDTRLSPGAARELIGAMLHPLNAPELDKARGVVLRGHGVLAPRIGVELDSAGKNDFARAFAGQGGTEPYGGACGDLYMDVWGRGGFAGKGIVEIDAYLACLGERVPENRMLSHDAVEGAFLRAGFAGDLEVMDGWPGSVASYYARMERWTRGDWQNLPYLFRAGRGLPDIEKWKLFDSLRRSMVPVLTLAALLFGFFRPALGITGAAALLALASELLLTGARSMLSRMDERTPRFHSALLVGMGGALVRTLLRLLLLPAEAWVCFSAACRALWRMGVSRRRLLEWRTAAQAEAAKRGVWGCYVSLWFAPACGVALLLFSPSIIGKAAGALWLLTPLSAWLLSLPAAPEAALSNADRRYLTDCARDTWKYFEDFLTPEDHYLPPDNVQIRPPVGAARRTSPTNIGMGLLSVLAGMDLEFTDRKRGLSLITGTLDTLEGLPKWRGHLYNWYDTAQASPLEPRYVSTVDSGNLCACLTALAGGLREYGREDLAERAAALARGMDFSALFDPKRKLFYIGIDPEAGEKPESWYDLMSSEARLTAYLAVARGDVPREHWRRLSRAQLAAGRYRGMASWTGTMFEYLMPELLLPLERDSLFYETAKFCLYVQRRRGREQDAPWGVSESAYAALDPAMSYRYKAHGCGALALKRGMDAEYIVSPYSSFLALAVEPKAALANLRRLEGLGMREEYGFWEALDYSTPGAGRGGPAKVRCVMAHHQGMSLVAAANALLDGAMRRRFLSEPCMRAYLGLLQEKVPLGGAVLQRGVQPPHAAKPARSGAASWAQEGAGTDFLRPRCCLLGSESYSLLAAETGLCRPLWGAISPYVPPRGPLDREKGVDVLLDADGATVSLLPQPWEAPERGWRFTTDSAAFARSGDGLKSEVLLTLPAGETGEKREITLTNTGEGGCRARLRLRFRPLLARERDYLSHPAFWGLGLSARTRDGALLLRRLPRNGTRELWLCLACTRPAEFDLSPGRGAGPEPAEAAERFLTGPLAEAAVALDLEPGQSAAVGFALALAYTEDGAFESAARMLRGGARADLPVTAATVVGLDPAELDAAWALLPLLSFPAAPGGAARQEELWRFGVSGDLPVLCAAFDDAARLDWARKLMDLHLFLTGCGADFDLVFLCRDGDGYHLPLKSALDGALWRRGGELLRDRKGGVHLVEDGPAAAPLRAWAVRVLAPGELPAPERRRTEYRAAPPLVSGIPPQHPVVYDWGEDGAFRFTVSRSLPPRAWQNLLTNGRFGYLATDCGTGHLWMENAREAQISPWLCQPCAAAGPEEFVLDSEGGVRSLFAAPEGGKCAVTYLPGAAVWETRHGGATVRLTAFVPFGTDARVFLVECENPPAGVELFWRLDLQLGPGRDAARFCRTGASGGFLWAENGALRVLAAATGQIAAYTFRRASALARDCDGAGAEGEPVFAARIPLRRRVALVCGCGRPERLLALTAPDAARAALADTLRRWREKTGVLSVRSSHRPLDRLVNGWLAYQALACRLLGRCSVYQSGGAYGFRDQLQDAVNLILLDPAPARRQILRCCARQYEAGDVQHWWHEEPDGTCRGVRTRCSDDLLWLPWALCEYTEQTGDAELCAETVPYLSSLPLEPGERDRYEAPNATETGESVLQHCRRALEQVMSRGVGPTGLLPILGGDWNDGFDRVGGESVWLSWFFLLTADRFAPLLEASGGDTAALRAFADRLERAVDAAWDGDWYLRGRYADGKPLGGKDSAECRIDSIAQSFAVLSGRADPEKADRALTSALERLFDREHGIVKLFDPPFAGAEHPGYLESYGPGFRENGGQYTHGAVWLALALFRAGRAAEGWEVVRALLPAGKDAATYRAEPFVLAADVYSAPGHAGEAGWSWYTGAAGWLLRTIAGELLGLRLRGGKLYLSPNLPPELPACTVRFRGHELELSGTEATVDGKPWDGKGIDL